MALIENTILNNVFICYLYNKLESDLFKIYLVQNQGL